MLVLNAGFYSLDGWCILIMLLYGRDSVHLIQESLEIQRGGAVNTRSSPIIIVVWLRTDGGCL
jgi:hypothetical protein